jgi:hypothetical protein
MALVYDYRCKQCGSETEAVNRIDERNSNAPVCCDQRMEIIIKKAPMGYMGREINYICPVTNERVTSKRQRRNIMAREGLVSAHEMVSSYDQRQKQVERSKELTRLSKQAPSEVTNFVNGWAKQEANI